MLVSVRELLGTCAALSLGSGALCYIAIPRAAQVFSRAGLAGKDLGKRHKPTIAESMGTICGLFYLLCLFAMMPVYYIAYENHPMNMFSTYLAAILTVQSMLFLGFADDVLNIKWRHKILLPALASTPMLILYYIHGGVTHVVLPKVALTTHFFKHRLLDLGPLYYVYMAMVAIFCTNSINILAGINGVEAGQSIVIGLATCVHSVVQLLSTELGSTQAVHVLTLVLTVPYVTTSLALIKYNWYPARVFVGDTYTYFSGIVFATSSILGHFTKTMLLLHAPQIFNFVFSSPQLFHVLPCPRHRLPRFDAESDCMRPSTAEIEVSKLSALGHCILRVAAALKLSNVTFSKDDQERKVLFTNFTIINMVLVWCAKFCPDTKIREPTLTKIIILIQVLSCSMAFIIRYFAVSLFYDKSQ